MSVDPTTLSSEAPGHILCAQQDVKHACVSVWQSYPVTVTALPYKAMDIAYKVKGGKELQHNVLRHNSGASVFVLCLMAADMCVSVCVHYSSHMITAVPHDLHLRYFSWKLFEIVCRPSNHNLKRTIICWKWGRDPKIEKHCISRSCLQMFMLNKMARKLPYYGS